MCTSTPPCLLVTHARVQPIQRMFTNGSCDGPVHAPSYLFDITLVSFLRVCVACANVKYVVCGGIDDQCFEAGHICSVDVDDGNLY